MSRLLVRATLALMLALAPAAAQSESSDIAIHSRKGSFDDVKERVVLAIENRGMVLNYTARVADMLERTGKDIGRERRVYSKAEVLEFCSARLSRDAMEADPRNIVYCPYAIAVYQLPREPERVYVSYRRLGAIGSGQSIRALRAVDRLLADIVRDALK